MFSQQKQLIKSNGMWINYRLVVLHIHSDKEHNTKALNRIMALIRLKSSMQCAKNWWNECLKNNNNLVKYALNLQDKHFFFVSSIILTKDRRDVINFSPTAPRWSFKLKRNLCLMFGSSTCIAHFVKLAFHFLWDSFQ